MMRKKIKIALNVKKIETRSFYVGVKNVMGKNSEKIILLELSIYIFHLLLLLVAILVTILIKAKSQEEILNS